MTLLHGFVSLGVLCSLSLSYMIGTFRESETSLGLQSVPGEEHSVCIPAPARLCPLDPLGTSLCRKLEATGELDGGFRELEKETKHSDAIHAALAEKEGRTVKPAGGDLMWEASHLSARVPAIYRDGYLGSENATHKEVEAFHRGKGMRELYDLWKPISRLSYLKPEDDRPVVLNGHLYEHGARPMIRREAQALSRLLNQAGAEQNVSMTLEFLNEQWARNKGKLRPEDREFEAWRHGAQVRALQSSLASRTYKRPIFSVLHNEKRVVNRCGLRVTTER